MRYEIWNKRTPINGVDAETFIKMMGYQEDDSIYIIYNDDNQPWIVQTEKTSPFSGDSIDAKAQNHLNSLMPTQEEVTQEEMKDEN